MKKTVSRQQVIDETRLAAKTEEVGLVLMDPSFKPIACDRGAAAILNGKTPAGIRPEPPSMLPKELLDAIGDRKPEELAASQFSLRMGSCEYSCRTYLMEPEDGFPAMVVLHIEKVSSVTDAVSAVAAKCHLTEREQEALRGISMGLSSKELAETMNISPNTVKVFLRLIMIKMGVTTRGGIVAQILQHLTEGPTRAALLQAARTRRKGANENAPQYELSSAAMSE